MKVLKTEEHANIAATYRGIADIYYLNGEKDTALQTYEKVFGTKIHLE